VPFKFHFIPRSRKGKIVTVVILGIYLLLQWPALQLANRIEPFILGMPFLYFYLLLGYLLIIGAMIYACKEGL